MRVTADLWVSVLLPRVFGSVGFWGGAKAGGARAVAGFPRVRRDASPEP